MLAATVPAAAGSFGYRGLNNSGIYPAGGLLQAWPKEGPELLWKRDVGLGYCSASVADGRVYVVHGVGQCALSVFSLEEGKPLGNVALGSAAWKRFGGSRSTPLIAEGVAVATMGTNAPAAVESLRQAVGHRDCAVRGAVLSEDGTTVALKTSPLMRRATYTLSVGNLKDRSICGNAANDTAKFQYMPVAAWKAGAAKPARAGAESVPEDEVTP